MELIDTISKNKGLADFLLNFALNCPNHPKSYKMLDIDIMKANFCRYTKRSMYYAENFMKTLGKIENDLKTRYDFKSELMTVISDDIYFDFDAFIFSCKSIVEGKIMERSKGFHSSVKNDFNNYAKSTFNRFVKSYLTPLRNEVVHLNNFGSAIGSMAWIKNNKLHIRAFDYSDDLELQKVFTTILTEMTSIINKVSVYIMLHECELWGFPEKDITFSTGYNEYKISDFIEIPNR
jgi:hypothetical protein